MDILIVLLQNRFFTRDTWFISYFRYLDKEYQFEDNLVKWYKQNKNYYVPLLKMDWHDPNMLYIGGSIVIVHDKKEQLSIE